MRSRTLSPSLTTIATATLLSAYISLVAAHTVITYPGYRGNNLIKNGTVVETNGLGEANGTFPYGMQWMYPCGGMPTSTNRTLWPITGGAIAIQPGWDVGHPTAFFYINMGFTTNAPNMSNPMVPPFQIQGPTRTQYPGTFCLPHVPLPVNAPNASVKIGDNATIQVIETGLHGGALYNCVDITFADPHDVAEVNTSNCFNSSDLSFQMVFTTTSLSAAAPSLSSTSYLAFAPLLLAGLVAALV